MLGIVGRLSLSLAEQCLALWFTERTPSAWTLSALTARLHTSLGQHPRYWNPNQARAESPFHPSAELPAVRHLSSRHRPPHPRASGSARASRAVVDASSTTPLRASAQGNNKPASPTQAAAASGTHAPHAIVIANSRFVAGHTFGLPSKYSAPRPREPVLPSTANRRDSLKYASSYPDALIFNLHSGGVWLTYYPCRTTPNCSARP